MVQLSGNLGRIQRELAIKTYEETGKVVEASKPKETTTVKKTVIPPSNRGQGTTGGGGSSKKTTTVKTAAATTTLPGSLGEIERQLAIDTYEAEKQKKAYPPVHTGGPLISPGIPKVGPRDIGVTLPGNLGVIQQEIKRISPVETINLDSTYARNKFLSQNPGLTLPQSQLGNYDRVVVGPMQDPNTGRLVRGYTFTYSDVAKQKIAVAGSVSNYDKYLQMVRSHPELPAIYNLMGGTGVGPLGIIPSMGVDLAIASSRRGPTGASEREEILIKYLHNVKGSPEGGATPGGAASFIIQNPYVQIAAMEALPIVASAATKGAVRVGGRAAPRIFAKLPIAKLASSKIVGATAKLGGPAGQKITQREIYRNFMKWATEGAKPALKTTAKVLSTEQAVKKLFRKGTTTVDDMGNIVFKATKEPIGYIDDFNRVILYKPKRTWGFAERQFLSPEQSQKYLDLLKKGTTKEASVISRFQKGKNPWAELQVLAEESGYKKTWRGIRHPYHSRTLKIRKSVYQDYMPDEALMKESDAFKKALLEGRIPGQDYGSLYNVQTGVSRELGKAPKLGGIGDEFIPGKELGKFNPVTGLWEGTGKKLPGPITIAGKKQIKTSMKNIWAGKKWNPFSQEWDEAVASLIRQPGMISQEEKAIVRQLKRGGTIFGKGAGKTVPSVFMIPIQRSGIETLFALGLPVHGGGQTAIPDFEYERVFPNIPKPKTRRDYKSEIDILNQIKEDQDRIIRNWSQGQGAKDLQKQYRQTQQDIDYVRDFSPVQDTAQDQDQQQRQVFETVQTATGEYVIIPYGSKPPRPIRKGRSFDYPFFPPPIPLEVGRGRGGKVGSKGRLGPDYKRFWNEYQAVQELMRGVIF